MRRIDQLIQTFKTTGYLNPNEGVELILKVEELIDFTEKVAGVCFRDYEDAIGEAQDILGKI